MMEFEEVHMRFKSISKLDGKSEWVALLEVIMILITACGIATDINGNEGERFVGKLSQHCYVAHPDRLKAPWQA
jgi:hypothetical protein